ncbi:hypothetical protein IKF12_03270 [Candidatus Saccharibacteria bacterium]|nr:hypothetical protein [Candidatus Saccharibacteria bacterium]
MNKRFLLKVFCGLLVVTGFCAIISNNAWAKCGEVDTSIIQCGDDVNGIGAVLKTVMTIFTVLVGILAVVGITIVGSQYMSARDNEETVRKSKRRLAEIVVGIFAYVLLFVGMNWLIPGGVPDVADLPVYEMPDIPTAPVYPEPSETPENPEKPVTPEPENPTNPTPTDDIPTPGTAPDGREWKCPNGPCIQRGGYVIKAFPVNESNGIKIRWPLLIMSGMEPETNGMQWLGHHGYIHRYDPDAAAAGQYKYIDPATGEKIPVYDLCGEIEGIQKGDYCYDNRVEGNNDGYFNGKVVTPSADPGNVDIYSRSGLPRAFYDGDGGLSKIVTGVNRILHLGEGQSLTYLYAAGMPVASLFDTSKDGKVVITSVKDWQSAVVGWEKNEVCRSIRMSVYEHKGDSYPIASMAYLHLSSYYPIAIDGRSEYLHGAPPYNVDVGDGRVIGYIGSSDCALNGTTQTGPHLHLSLHVSEMERYDLQSLLKNKYGGGISERSNLMSYDQVLNTHFYVLCDGSSNSNCTSDLWKRYRGGGSSIDEGTKKAEKTEDPVCEMIKQGRIPGLSLAGC